MATLSITITPSDAARVVTAFGAHMGLGRDATQQEVKSAVIDWIKSVVTREERIAAAVPNDVSPT